MELIQLGSPQPKPMTIREMFALMAEREAEMIRAARRTATGHATTKPGCESAAS